MIEQLTLRRAVEIFNIDCNTNKRTANIVCPECGHGTREKKLHLAFDENGNDDGVFRCSKCGVSGKALHFWAMLRNLSTTDMTAVANDYYTYSRSNNLPVTTKKREYVRKDVDVANIKIRDATYTALLNILHLNGSHRKSLLSRGLDNDAIERNVYRSYPVVSLQHICELLLSQGCILEGIPGFYQQQDGRWTMLRFSGGFLIPQRNGFNQIQGMQIRLDKEGGPRYLTVSTGDEYLKGAKGKAYCHLAQGGSLETIILTEGALKADIISFYTGMTVLAIPGVNSTAYLEKAIHDLKMRGTKKVAIAFDMDLYDNIFVKKALRKVMQIIQYAGLSFSLLIWDKTYKGLDDYYHFKQSSI